MKLIVGSSSKNDPVFIVENASEFGKIELP